MALYELAVMGAPTAPQIRELERYISEITDLFGLRLGHEIGWSVLPNDFAVAQKTPAAVAFFGAENVSSNGLDDTLRNGIPVLPIASMDGRITAELPNQLRRSAMHFEP
jgi:hypothetical protein